MMSYKVSGRRARRRKGMAWGLLAVLLAGIAMLVFGIGINGLMPLLAGVALFAVVKRGGREVSGLTIPATMATVLGLILMVQGLTPWGSWLYSWPLLFPGAFGMGLAVHGQLNRKRGTEQVGEEMAKVGVGIFLVGALFFEVIVGLGGWVAGMLAWLLMPLLALGGVIYLLTRSRRARRGTAALGGRQHGALDDGSSRLDTLLFEEDRERV